MKEVERKVAASLGDYIKSAKDAGEVFRWVWQEVMAKDSRKYFIKMLVCLTVAIFLQALQPGAIGYVFQGLSAHNQQMVLWGIGSFGFLLLIHKQMDRMQQEAREWVAGLNWKQMDDRITKLFFSKSIAQHIHEGSRLSTSNIDKGRWRVIELQSLLLFEGFPTLIQLSISFICLSILDWISCLVMLSILTIYLLWCFYLNYQVSVVCTPIERDFRRLNRRRLERWEQVERVKVSGKEDVEVAEMSEIFSDVIRRDRNFWIWYIGNAILRGHINILGRLLIMSWGAWLVYSGKWNIGWLYPLYAWTTQVSDNMWRLGDIEHRINWNMPTVKSMIGALKIEPSIKDVSDAVELDTNSPHTVEFRAVSHTYPAEKRSPESNGGGPAAIVKISFQIKPGEKVACIGPSGAGKSTIMKAMLRFDDPTDGQILVDGVDLRQISQASWRRGIGYIPQQSQVLDGPIRYNLTYGLTPEEKARTTDEELWTLMRALQIDFKERLTKGLDTLVGKNGLKLSGGQAQRLMIGSAVIKKPWLLIIDEATASLDSTTEKQVQAGLAQALSGQTSALIVAHRLSTVRKLCTKFVVLKPASEVKNGDSQVEAVADSFEELYKISPTFRRLADDQEIVIKTP